MTGLGLRFMLAMPHMRKGPHLPRLSSTTNLCPGLTMCCTTQLTCAQDNRRTAETQQNDRSSRSHTVVRLSVESRPCPAPRPEFDPDSLLPASYFQAQALQQQQQQQTTVTTSLVTLVDLAGSEGLGRIGSEGQQLVEGKAINKSLLALGKVMRLLATGGKGASSSYNQG